MYKSKSYFFIGDAVYGFQQCWEHVIVWDINFKSCLPVIMTYGEFGMLKAISATSNSLSLEAKKKKKKSYNIHFINTPQTNYIKLFKL